ncbi:MAG: hypothetical protein ACLQIH_11115 [Myxococcaceae bacterium]
MRRLLDRREVLESCVALGTLTLVSPLGLGGLTEAWAASEQRRATPFCELGPFYKRGAPASTVIRAAGDSGLPLALSGAVFGTGGELLLDAKVEIWQTDNAGHYDIDGFRYRAVLSADAKGQYAVESVMPGHYPGRVAQHVHYLVTAPGHRPLTTQLYFATDPVFDGEPQKNFHRDPLITSLALVRPVLIEGDPQTMRARVQFDLVLEKA